MKSPMLVFLTVLPDFTAGVSEVFAPDMASTAPASDVASFLVVVGFPEDGLDVVLGAEFGLLPTPVGAFVTLLLL